MKYIDRWALMRNTREENLCEHSYETAVLAHALATLTNRRFGGRVDVGRCVLLCAVSRCVGNPDRRYAYTGEIL